MEWLQGLIMTGFVLVHLLAHRLRFLNVIPRSRWLSLAGGVVLNVLKEELPEERASRFTPVALGAGAYAGLLLL